MLLKNDTTIIRVLKSQGGKALVIDCIKRTMPKWVDDDTFAPTVGMGMLDSTICDIYLVDDGGNLVGRPVMTACVDAFSGLCCGYSLGWEGGTYSLRSLMLNVITDKQEWCENHGIFIEAHEWDSNKLPGVLVTDMGSEYKGDTFSQVAELGVPPQQHR